MKKVYSKHAKYLTKNPISRLLVTHFITTIRKIVHTLQPHTLLDCGCGEGIILYAYSHDLNKTHCYAMDSDAHEVEDALKNNPHCTVFPADIYHIPYKDNSFDLVVCTEVLEHVKNPQLALKELVRVSQKYVLISVPREPLWRIMNILRFSYLKDFGNTPGHVNHWSKKKFLRFLSKNTSGYPFCVKRPIPWTIVCLKK